MLCVSIANGVFENGKPSCGAVDFGLKAIGQDKHRIGMAEIHTADDRQVSEILLFCNHLKDGLVVLVELFNRH